MIATRTPETRFAEAYGVTLQTLINWRKRQLPIEDPAALLLRLAQQRNPGTVFARLSRPEVLAATTAAIAQLTAR